MGRWLPVWDATLVTVLVGAVVIGVTSGVLGTFAVLRKRSLLGDALAHAALPGVAVSFLLTGSKSLPVLLLGATLSGILGVLIIQLIVQYTRIKSDAALGIVLSVFFGIGIVLLTHIQQTAVGNQSGLDKFLFGQAASIVHGDLVVMCGVAVVVLCLVGAFYKEFRCLVFDPGFLKAVGFSPRRVDLLLMALIVLTVMVGLQAVGVILVAALLITPAVAARFWTEKLHVMLVLAACVGAVSGALGAGVSALAPRIPTGPVMVLVATGAFLLSVCVAPRRGVLARWRRLRQNSIREETQHLLRACVELRHEDKLLEGVDLSALASHMQIPLHRVRRLVRKTRTRGLVDLNDDALCLTPDGQREADHVLKSHRLWEYYLVYRSILEQDHVDRPADEVEHVLTPQILEQLEDILAREKVDVTHVPNIHGTPSGYRKAGRDA